MKSKYEIGTEIGKSGKSFKITGVELLEDGYKTMTAAQKEAHTESEFIIYTTDKIGETTEKKLNDMIEKLGLAVL